LKPKPLKIETLMSMLKPDKAFAIAMQVGEICLEAICIEFSEHIFIEQSIVLYSGDRDQVSILLQNWVYAKLVRAHHQTNSMHFSQKEKEFYLGLVARSIVVFVCLLTYPENPTFGRK
jgi:hypothetical protein